MDYGEFKLLTRSDLWRYSGKSDFWTFMVHMLVTPGFKYTYFMRFCAYLKTKRFGPFLYPFAKFLLNHYTYKFGISISYKTRVGYGFYIGHFGCIVVNYDAVIGKNCTISQGVTIATAKRGKRMGAPVIGDNVYIGPGAKIIGKVRIGNDVAVGANAVVASDIPDHSVVVGVPGRVISKAGATGYIARTDY